MERIIEMSEVVVDLKKPVIYAKQIISVGFGQDLIDQTTQYMPIVASDLTEEFVNVLNDRFKLLGYSLEKMESTDE